MPVNRTTHRLQASPDIRCQVELTICNLCEAACWSVSIWAHDIAGSGERVCLLYRDHLSSQSLALIALGRWLSGAAINLREQEVKTWQLEHQLPLF